MKNWNGFDGRELAGETGRARISASPPLCLTTAGFTGESRDRVRARAGDGRLVEKVVCAREVTVQDEEACRLGYTERMFEMPRYRILVIVNFKYALI